MTAHCNCGRDWASLTECHCTVCHAHFSNISSFDRHQPTRGGCPDPAALRDRDGNPALRLVDRSSGPTWIAWQSDDDRAAMKARLAKARDANAGSRSRPRSDEQAASVSLEG